MLSFVGSVDSTCATVPGDGTWSECLHVRVEADPGRVSLRQLAKNVSNAGVNREF